jgi:diguanylate cyclase
LRAANPRLARRNSYLVRDFARQFTMVEDKASAWKERCLRGIDELAQKERHWAGLEEALRRAIGRLAITSRGLDVQLDRELDRIRDAVRSGEDIEQLERLVRAVTESTVRVQEQRAQWYAENACRIAAILQQPAFPKAVRSLARRLRKSALVPENAEQLQLLRADIGSLLEAAGVLPQVPAGPPEDAAGRAGRGLLRRWFGASRDDAEALAPSAPPSRAADGALAVSDLLARCQRPAADDWAERFGALRTLAATCHEQVELERLLEQAAALISQLVQVAESSRAGEITVIEALPSAGEALLELLQRLDIPDYLQQRTAVIRGTLGHSATPRQLVVAVQAIADLVGDIRKALLEEKRTLEHYLKGVTDRVQIMAKGLFQTEQYRQASMHARHRFHDDINQQFAGMRERMDESRQLEQLKLTIEDGLNAIESSMERFVIQEDQFSQQTQAEIERLSQRLREVEGETEAYQRKVREERIRAGKDSLTGLPNRLSLEQRLDDEYLRWKRFKEDLSLVMMDIDEFSALRDNYGQYAADKVLKSLAVRLAQNVREVDYLCRYGSRSFTILLPRTGVEQALGVTEKLRANIDRCRFSYKNTRVAITLSCGIAGFAGGDQPAEVIKRARDTAAEIARQGGNQARLAESAG